MANKRLLIAALKAVAALAESTAMQVENKSLWEGELSHKLGEIRAQLGVAESEADDRGR